MFLIATSKDIKYNIKIIHLNCTIILYIIYIYIYTHNHTTKIIHENIMCSHTYTYKHTNTHYKQDAFLQTTQTFSGWGHWGLSSSRGSDIRVQLLGRSQSREKAVAIVRPGAEEHVTSAMEIVQEAHHAKTLVEPAVVAQHNFFLYMKILHNYIEAGMHK